MSEQPSLFSVDALDVLLEDMEAQRCAYRAREAARAWKTWSATRDPSAALTREEMEAELPPGWAWTEAGSAWVDRWWFRPSKMARRQARNVAAGLHPTGFALHADGLLPKSAEDRPTCGNCLRSMKHLAGGRKAWWKCRLVEANGCTGKAGDIRVGWGACEGYRCSGD